MSKRTFYIYTHKMHMISYIIIYKNFLLYTGHNLYKKFGYEKLEENFLTLNFKGSAGQSFGAFAAKGLKLKLL